LKNINQLIFIKYGGPSTCLQNIAGAGLGPESESPASSVRLQVSRNTLHGQRLAAPVGAVLAKIKRKLAEEAV
jgi:hypothetical protein